MNGKWRNGIIVNSITAKREISWQSYFRSETAHFYIFFSLGSELLCDMYVCIACVNMQPCYHSCTLKNLISTLQTFLSTTGGLTFLKTSVLLISHLVVLWEKLCRPTKSSELRICPSQQLEMLGANGSHLSNIQGLNKACTQGLNPP